MIRPKDTQDGRLVCTKCYSLWYIRHIITDKAVYVITCDYMTWLHDKITYRRHWYRVYVNKPMVVHVHNKSIELWFRFVVVLYMSDWHCQSTLQDAANSWYMLYIVRVYTLPCTDVCKYMYIHTDKLTWQVWHQATHQQSPSAVHDCAEIRHVRASTSPTVSDVHVKTWAI